MKTRKLLCLIFITFCLIFSLNAEENSVQDIKEMAILNYAVNKDNSLMLINTASYEDWSSVIYACNPGKGNLNWGFQKIWDKSKISGCIRTLIYSPFSEKFYFLVFLQFYLIVLVSLVSKSFSFHLFTLKHDFLLRPQSMKG